MTRRGVLFWAVIAASVLILTYQVLIPPVIGLADQGDFRRIIGRFGYGPEHADGSLNVAFVEPKYVRSADFRAPDWEQVSSEYLFVAIAVLVNQVISRDGKLDITVMGVVHALAFVAIFTRLLWVTRRMPAAAFLWIGSLLILTDAGYAAYWNSFYAEPASLLFCLLLIAESIALYERGNVSPAGLLGWSLCAVLLVLAKPQNAPVGLLLAAFALRLWTWVRGPASNIAPIAASAAISAAAVITFFSAPTELKNACTYNLVFKAILPESRYPAVDLQALGMDPRLQDYSRTGAWSPGTMFPALEESGVIGTRVTHATVVRFYLLRPARLWRHIQALLPVMTSLRPEHCGNFEPSAGQAPGAISSKFAMWSAVHERALARAAKFILFTLLIVPLLVLRRRGLGIEMLVLLALGCLIAFLTAAFGDAWDNVKHFFLFNVLLDACLMAGVACIWRAIRASKVEV